MSQAKNNFAYASYVGTNEHDPKKKYKIKWNDKCSYGTIAFFGETEDHVREEAEKHRPKIIPENLLLSNTDDDSADETNVKKCIEKKCADSLRQKVLNRKLQQLKDTQDKNNSNVEISEIEVNNNTQDVTETQIGTDENKMKNLVEDVKKLKLEVDKLKLKNDKLLAKNTETEKMLKDSELLNIELQKEVINVVQEMKGETNKASSSSDDESSNSLPPLTTNKGENLAAAVPVSTTSGDESDEYVLLSE